MDPDFFTNLPQEMMIDILSRLPVQSIMRCKCVCSSWRDLTKTREFIDSHVSRSVACLALFQTERFSNTCKIIEFVDTQNCGENHCNMVSNFSFPHQTLLHGSANGLLILSSNNARDLFICNPITREYINVAPSVKVSKVYSIDVFGFGVSKLSGEYKVVRLFYEEKREFTGPRDCEVYSLRRGSWRSVQIAGDHVRFAYQLRLAVFFNGNLHWLVGPYFGEGRVELPGILCFDLETECFSTFFIPRLQVGSMCTLGDRLCLCDVSLDGFVIWSMDEYGDDKSWRKEFVIKISSPLDRRRGYVVPIKVFKDGDILFVHQFIFKLYCYSSKTRTIREIDADESFFKVGTRAFIHAPSFVPLKTFTMENNVISF